MTIAIRKGFRVTKRSDATPPPEPTPTPQGPDDSTPLEDETAPPAGYLANLVGGGLVPLGIGVVGIALSIQLGLGSFGDPGPGLWPAVICGVLVLMSGVLVVGGKRFHNAESITRQAITVVIAIATLAGLVAAMPYVGFEIPTAVLAFVWMKFLGGEKWWVSAVVAVAITAVAWLLFIQLFRIPFPHLF